MFSDLIKARQHKYIKRVPKAGGGYTYFYREQHGGGVALKEHMKAGAAFRLTHNGQEGHFHIKALDGERLTVEHDETRVKVEMTRDELAALLTRQHRQALQADADKKRARAEKLKRETPHYIGNKRAENLAAEAEARLKVGEDIKSAATENKLAREVLEKARVTPEKVAAALASFSKSRASALLNPDVMFRYRLQKLTAGNIADYCEQYNQALERAAQDNAAVLSAIAVYKQAKEEALAAHPAAEMSDKERHQKIEHYTKAAQHEFLTAISAANADFLHKSTPTNTLHARHKPAPRTPINPEQFSGLGTLAHLEDILGRAYPARTHQITHIEMLMPSLTFRGECYKGTITLSTVSTLATAAHELAHTLEQHGPAYAGIERAVTLTHATRIRQGEYKQYNGKEMYFEDQYTDNYTGKLYPNGASELVSTGVENFFTSTEPDIQLKAIADFAAADPHHYLLTYAILKGYTQP